MSSSRVFVLVTGASRGFGKCVAEELVRKVAPECPIDLVLVARSGAGLSSTADAIEDIKRGIAGVAEVVIRQEAMDLGDMEQLESLLDALLDGVDPKRYSRALLVNNAGSVGRVGPANELPSLSTLRGEMDFNVTSALWLASRFARLFGVRQKPQKSQTTIDSSPNEEPAPALDTDDVQEDGRGDGETGSGTRDASRNVIVNVSSLAAVQPFESWCGYSTGKAARDMSHRVLALEQDKIGGLRVLNYAPGPMDTDMSRDVRTVEEYEDDMRNKRLVDPKLSAEKCVRLALDNKFATGSHIDYFDEEDTG